MMMLSDGEIFVLIVFAVVVNAAAAAVWYGITMRLPFPAGIVIRELYSKTDFSGYHTSSGHTPVHKSTLTIKYISPEYMLKKGKFHKVKSKMHKRKKEHQLDFAEIEKNNFAGFEYLKKPYLLPCKTA